MVLIGSNGPRFQSGATRRYLGQMTCDGAVVVWLEAAFRRARSTAHTGLEHGHRVVSTVGVSPRRKSDKWRHRWTPHHRTHLRTAYTDTAPPAAPPLACGITVGRSAIGTVVLWVGRDIL